MSEHTVAVQSTFLPPETANRVAVRRHCACGAHSSSGADCAACSKKTLGLPRGLALGAVNDPQESEADRAAEWAVAEPVPAAGGALPPILRPAEPAGTARASAPLSIGRILASSGSLLEPALRHDMEQRLGHDFSRVRVHSDAAAAASAQAVDASAYTVGHHVVFGAGRFAPATHGGRRLLAHELTHVTQQGGEQRLVQRAPVNYPSNEPVAPTGPTPDPTAQKSTPQPTPDDLIAMLVSLRVNSSPQRVAQFLAANESLIYPLLRRYGFRGSWTTDQGYLDDFDAAIRQWSRSHRHQFASAAARHPVVREKPKSPEQRRYETAKFLIADMNRHGYGRGTVNDELESAGLMDDLVNHGFERHAAHSFKDHVDYQNEAIAALVDYVDRYDAAHGIKHQASVNVPTQGEDIEFYRAWLEGLGYVTSSFFAAAAAATASKFTSDPKKITAAAGLGAAFEGVVFSVAGAKPGSYRPEVVKAPDRPAAVGAWRYEGKQPVKAAVDPARVASPPVRDPIPPPDPMVKRVPPAAPPRSISAAPKFTPQPIGDLLGSGPETAAVNPTTAARTGRSREPLHHVYPQQYREWFEARGFTGPRDIDNFCIQEGVGAHEGIHGGGSRALVDWTGPKVGASRIGVGGRIGVAVDWNTQVMVELTAAEDAKGSRLTVNEITTHVEALMKKYKIEGPYVRYRR